jgi:hypothetical protein
LPQSGLAEYDATSANRKPLLYPLSYEAIAQRLAAGLSHGRRAISGADLFSYGPTPTVMRVKPNSGSGLGGTCVTLTGTNFVTGAMVLFGGNAGSNVVVVSSTKITVTSPAGDSCGHTLTVDVQVQTNFGTSPISSGDQFTYAILGGPIPC